MRKNIFKRFLVVVLCVGIASCETLELDLQENPDSLNLESANVDLVFNQIQFNFLNQMRGSSTLVDNSIRMVHLFGTYTPGQGSMNGLWSTTYNTGTNITALETFAERDGFTFHLGAAQVMLASMYVNLVDYIGTAVYSEANQPSEFPNPGLDDGESIYAAALAMIDEGIANLQGTGRAPATDLYFDGDASAWIKYANTLKLRMYLQTRLVGGFDGNASAAGINSLISGGQLIDEISEDLQFQYGTTTAPIESRHPLFTGNYINGAGEYMSNGLMSYMKDSMTVVDPRMTYYFYRQTDRDLSSNPSGLLPCAGDPNYDYCYIGGLYYGRDHADNEGIPNDGNLRTTYGIYPAMGAYDDGSFVAALTTSAQGNGIHPLHLSSWTHFMLAEAALTLGTTGDAATYLENGMRQSLEKVRSFSPSNMTTGQIDDYVAEVLAEYVAAGNTRKLDIIAREWYISSFTNALLPYNTYRRTGMPSFLQDPVIAAGAFVRSYFLPESELNSNSNEDFSTQKQVTDQVFWDNNPASFIN